MKLVYITAVYGVFAKDGSFCQGQYDTEEDAQAACAYYHAIDGQEYYYETAVNSPLPELPNRRNVGYGPIFRLDKKYYRPPRQDKSPWEVDRILELKPGHVSLYLQGDTQTVVEMTFEGSQVSAVIPNTEAFDEIKAWALYYGYILIQSGDRFVDLEWAKSA